MKRYRIMAYSLFAIAIISIISFHSYMNLIERATPPSGMWARHISIGETNFRKPPSVFAEGGNLSIIYADEAGFRKTTVDNKGFTVGSKEIRIRDYMPNRLVKYQNAGNNIFWTENYDLYYADTNAADISKKLLLREILDYELINYDNRTLIAVAAKDTLSLYSFSDGKISKISQDVNVGNIYYIAAARDEYGAAYIAASSKNSPSELGLRLFSFESGKGELRERITPVTIENLTTTREGSNSMNNLKVAFDDKDVYVFYEMGKSSSQGIVARTFMARLPKESDEIADVSFERLKADVAGDEEIYISSLDCVDEVSDKLNAVFLTPIRTSIKREGTELMFITIDEGKVVYKSVASNTGESNRFASIDRVNGEYMATFLQVLGGIDYRIKVTGTGEAFKNNLNRTTFQDVSLSIMDTVGSYVFSFFPIFINLLLIAPILFWPISVDFFEWKVFFRNPILTLNIGAAAESIAMYFSIQRIYKNELYKAVAYMPEFLRHPAAPFMAAAATALISYAFIRLYRKSKVDMHSFPELALFMLVHNIIVYFLYTAYIARF